MRIAPLFLLILFLASSANAQPATRPFSEATSLPDLIAPVAFEFSQGGYQYQISVTGKGSRKSDREQLQAFNLQLDKHDRLTRTLYYREYGGDLLLIGEVGDEESGAGFIVRLDRSTLRMKWKRAIPGFNIGQGLSDEDYAYVTCIGFIAKVNLKTGAYMWRHDNLYQRGSGAFNSFELPEVNGNVVIFRESTDYLPKKKATIRVQRDTGKIMSITS